MGLTKQLIAIAVLAALGYGGYLLVWPLIGPADSRQTEGASHEAVRVITTPAEISPEVTRVEAVGTAEAQRAANIYPAAAGEVVAVEISPNKFVRQGDLLLELNSEAEALAVELAEVRVKDARQLLARYERTAGTGAVPASTIDEARIALEEAEIALRQARLDLTDRMTLAPFDGYVGMTEIEIGDRIDEGDLITTLDDRTALLVSFAIPEAFLGEVDIGQDVSVTTWANRERSVAGEIVDVGSRIDPVSRSFMARARVENSQDQLRPGMSFAVAIELRGEDYVLAPEVAVQWGGDGAYLWVVRDGKAERVQAAIVQRQEGTVLVDAAVAAGESLVVEGLQRMREGIDVEATPRSEDGV